MQVSLQVVYGGKWVHLCDDLRARLPEVSADAEAAVLLASDSEGTDPLRRVCPYDNSSKKLGEFSGRLQLSPHGDTD